MPRATLDRLPDVIFTCETLRFLKLNLPGNVLTLPNAISLINLQTLHLVSMSFGDDNVIWELLSSCPKLENLRINNCSMLGMNILSICSNELQNLAITYCQTISTVELKLSAPKLQSFRYRCPLPLKFSLENMHSLSNVDIDFHGSLYFVKKDKDLATRTVKILHGLDNVRTLILSARCIEYLSAALDLLGNFSWKLNNVSHLDLTLWYHKSYIKVLTSLFKCCSAVEFLCVGVDYLKTVPVTDEELGRRSRTAVPKCPLLKLKTVMLRQLGGINKLDLVRFLVKNADVLEKIITVSKDGVIKERTVQWIKNGAHSPVITAKEQLKLIANAN
ncbi:hypothetical protein J5N97_027259 [Dioscorea zingiberensis]|uniref:At1g61320/AtMIF1 LRR domain-containing protein n=1 Tax=Dioscorea zingiberensis TaxID=325984 RepID=A0A9D5H7F9_9LILI|nr:hypothetical protein J5N97_027259 [Dioscorea zingiberensis]